MGKLSTKGQRGPPPTAWGAEAQVSPRLPRETSPAVGVVGRGCGGAGGGVRKLLDLRKDLQLAGSGVGGQPSEKTGVLMTALLCALPMPHFPLPPSHGTPVPLLANPKPLGQVADSDCGGGGSTGPISNV